MYTFFRKMSSDSSSDNEEREFTSSSIAHGIVTTDAVPIPPTIPTEPPSVQARNESNVSSSDTVD